MSYDDEVKINKYTNNKLNQFLERTNKTFLSDKIGSSDKRALLTTFKIKPDLMSKFKFVTENLNTYTEKIPLGTNLIFCRNCWPYLWRSTDEFAQKISDKVDKNSYLVLGNFDYFFCPMLNKNCYGFSMSKDFLNVCDKSGSDYFDKSRTLFHGTYQDIL